MYRHCVRETILVVAMHSDDGRDDRPARLAGALQGPPVYPPAKKARAALNRRRDSVDVVLAQEPRRDTIAKFGIHTNQPGMHDRR
jgi:hypothetical protein